MVSCPLNFHRSWDDRCTCMFTFTCVFSFQNESVAIAMKMMQPVKPGSDASQSIQHQYQVCKLFLFFCLTNTVKPIYKDCEGLPIICCFRHIMCPVTMIVFVLLLIFIGTQSYADKT